LSPDELLALRKRRRAHLRTFLERLGNPECAFRSVHVGGTSGKGSTAAFAHAILSAAGRRSGLHTSPYLQVPIEKLVLGDRYLRPSAFAALVEGMKPAIEEFGDKDSNGPVGYGELWVALTFLCFAQKCVEFGVVEVGAGGRWDYTNVLPSSVAIITSIGYDHIRSLGPTLADIAGHKAGIVKPGIPVIVGPLDEDSQRIIAQESVEKGAPMWRYGREFSMEPAADGGFRYRGLSWRLHDLRPSLVGAHQTVNAALAIAAIEALGCLDLREVEPAVRTAMATTRFPGRFEIMQGHPTVILDGAHNEQKTRALAVALREQLAKEGSRRLTLVFGALASKSARDMLAALAPLSFRVITTAPTVYQKTSADPAELATLAKG
jgi:dihydrofolate synthase/folylpolyglutamate synthase